MLLYHITEKDRWLTQAPSVSYTPDGFEKEGFIHCSTAKQVLDVANKFYKGQNNLLLLEIDSNLVTARIIFENLEGGEEQFPHIYGKLKINAVITISAFSPDETGAFRLPVD